MTASSLSLRSATTAAWLLAGALAVPACAIADVDEGQELFELECSICHVALPEQKAAGPALEGVVDRQAGKLEGYLYSEAVRASEVVWTEDMLDTYLVRPQDAIPGMRSTFKGMPLAEDRASLIEYLKSIRTAAP